VRRIDPLSCHIRVAGRRIEGVPLFDATFTDAEGIRGTLGLLGSDADIALVETEPFTLVEPRRELGGALARARRNGHKGIVILTRGSRPGLFLLNAPSFRTPFGPPAVQISSAEAERLTAQARWLETMPALEADQPARDCLFAAFGLRHSAATKSASLASRRS
jgi:hypothetical protein